MPHGHTGPNLTATHGHMTQESGQDQEGNHAGVLLVGNPSNSIGL